MDLIKKWWFWLLVVLGMILLYFILVVSGVIPTYQCISSMGPEGPVSWCGWYKGTVVG